MPKTMRLCVRWEWDGSFEKHRYVAYVFPGRGTPFQGNTPDEALGCLLRELAVQGSLAEPVKLEIDIQSDREYGK